MQIKQPKNSDKYYWTRHVYEKMKQYSISEQTIKRIIRNPERVEEGIAPGTNAVMQSRGQKRKHEIWVMFQPKKTSKKQKHESQKTVITAWRYPGVSPVRQAIPIPEDILDELNNMD